MSLYKSGGGVIRIFVVLLTAAVLVAGNAIAQTPQSPEEVRAQQAQAGAAIAETLFQTEPAPIIQGIAVRGNQRIEPETVASYLPVQAGMPADEELLDVSLKTLFRTGLFSDVKLEMQPGDILLIEVVENPIVNRVLFEGNRRIKDEKISEEIELAPRGIYTRAKVQSDVQAIIEQYRAKGRFAATVTPKVTPLEQNRIDVIFEIAEGPKTGIAKVNFIGNDIFTDNELRGVILTKESRWWRFFTNYDNYDPDRLEYERELLRQHYGQNGYADFSVVSSVAELTPDRKDFFVTFTVDEGPQYTVGEVRVKTTLAKLDGDALVNYVPLRAGQVFDSEKIEKAVEALTFATGSVGYAFVDVNPRLIRHAESNTIDITFEVNEGPRVYVERINIKGNTRTLDKVIRREIRLAEGDAFNRVLVDRSKARIRSLGYFKEVEIEERPGSAPDRTELDVSVEEQSTGSFSVGVGVSSTENFILDLSVEERNLMGRGQFLRFRIQASSRTRQVDLRFTQPYFLDRNLAAGGSIFNQRTDFRESGFIRNRIGFGLNAGFQVSEYARGGINYLLTRDSVTIDSPSFQDIGINDDPASILLPGLVLNEDYQTAEGTDTDGNEVLRVSSSVCNFLAQSLTPTCESRGDFLTSLVGFSLNLDTRNDPITPTRGWRAGATVSVAGLGGDVNYYQTELNGAYYKPLFAGFVGALKGRAGYIDGYAGDDVRLSDRFFEGASTFRGFEVAGVGPRYLTRFDANRGQPVGQSIGAKAYAIGSAEILLPLPLPDEYGIRAALFSDFGTVGLVDDSTKSLNSNMDFFVDSDGDSIPDLAPIQDDLSLRVSAGVTVSWDSPFGPVRFDFAEVLIKEEYDETEGFRFSAGTSF
ncbi:outer membrane protein assembly factor BamA [Hyphococcus flavus]|uniref:Outer membrane protein assembly factor BamA n=1 Tax=Hyphococcus flavus TaxID=1866326 RepID=A0AAE9ZE57_9PROT|nr:outer membrane protein assembly factor BamA [Hyphococcus flavus]WDI31038.1 outer membrane protein assembly factor BamA [Hyphococcus flavus]